MSNSKPCRNKNQFIDCVEIFRVVDFFLAARVAKLQKVKTKELHCTNILPLN